MRVYYYVCSVSCVGVICVLCDIILCDGLFILCYVVASMRGNTGICTGACSIASIAYPSPFSARYLLSATGRDDLSCSRAGAMMMRWSLVHFLPRLFIHA